MNRCPAALGFRNHRDDLGQHRFRTDLVRTHDQRARTVHGAPDDGVADGLARGHRLAGDHGFVDGAASLEDHAVHGHPISWTHAQTVPDLHGCEWDFLVFAACGDAPGGLRCEVQQRTDRTAGLLASAQFENLADEDQHRDHRGRLEVDGDGAVHAAKAPREDFRSDGRDDAVEIGRARAECDEAEHVEATVDERGPCAFEKRPTRPQYYGRRQNEFNPRRDDRRHETVQAESRNMTSHLQREDRKREDGSNPEPPRHVDELFVRARLGRHNERLKSHSTDRAISGSVSSDLRVHRASINRPHFSASFSAVANGSASR